MINNSSERKVILSKYLPNIQGIGKRRLNPQEIQKVAETILKLDSDEEVVNLWDAFVGENQTDDLVFNFADVCEYGKDDNPFAPGPISERLVKAEQTMYDLQMKKNK